MFLWAALGVVLLAGYLTAGIWRAIERFVELRWDTDRPAVATNLLFTGLMLIGIAVCVSLHFAMGGDERSPNYWIRIPAMYFGIVGVIGLFATMLSAAGWGFRAIWARLWPAAD